MNKKQNLTSRNTWKGKRPSRRTSWRRH